MDSVDIYKRIIRSTYVKSKKKLHFISFAIKNNKRGTRGIIENR